MFGTLQQQQPAAQFPNIELKTTFSSLPPEIQKFFSEKHAQYHSILDVNLDKITADANKNAELCSSISQLLVAIKTKLPQEKQLLNQVQIKLNFIEKEVRAQFQIANWLRLANSNISQVEAYFNREDKFISSSTATIREILSDFDRQLEDYQSKIRELEEFFQTSANESKLPSTSFLSEVLSAQKEAFFLLSSRVTEMHEKVETLKNQSNLKFLTKLDFALPPVEPYQNQIVQPTQQTQQTPSLFSSTPSTSLFSATPTATPTTATTNPFGSTSNPFGSTTPATSNPFGSTTPAASNPFGSTTPAASNPFGSTTPAASNPFASTTPAASNPFASTTQTSNPFGGGSIFGK